MTNPNPSSTPWDDGTQKASPFSGGCASPFPESNASASPLIPLQQGLTNIPCCPVCGGGLMEIRAKFQCSRCHRICETCCEGGRG